MSPVFNVSRTTHELYLNSVVDPSFIRVPLHGSGFLLSRLQPLYSSRFPGCLSAFLIFPNVPYA